MWLVEVELVLLSFLPVSYLKHIYDNHNRSLGLK